MWIEIIRDIPNWKAELSDEMEEIFLKSGKSPKD